MAGRVAALTAALVAVFVACAPVSVAAPGPSGSADGIDISIATQDSTVLRPGGPPFHFTVTLVNASADDIAQVGMVVSLSHCECGSPGLKMMPQGSMRLLDPKTNAWVPVPYDREGGGMDFIYQTLVPPFDLRRGETVAYQLEMQIDAQQGFTVGRGNGAIHVTRTNVATHEAIGATPTASLPISVEP